MSFSFDQHSPIYLQIIREIKRQIVNEELKEGDKMPSVRDLSEQMNVNPNTVQRAYQELERLGITHTLRGMGNFVTDNKEIIRSMKNEMAKSYIQQFVQGMKTLGMSQTDMLNTLKEYFVKEEF